MSVDAMGRCGMDGHNAHPTDNIDPTCHRLKMRRSELVSDDLHTMSNAAEMIRFEACGHWADEQLVNNAMDHLDPSIPRHAPVSVGAYTTVPNPARAEIRRVIRDRTGFVDFRPYSFNGPRMRRTRCK
jgi:hypothetical protein